MGVLFDEGFVLGVTMVTASIGIGGRKSANITSSRCLRGVVVGGNSPFSFHMESMIDSEYSLRMSPKVSLMFVNFPLKTYHFTFYRVVGVSQTFLLTGFHKDLGVKV